MTRGPLWRRYSDTQPSVLAASTLMLLFYEPSDRSVIGGKTTLRTMILLHADECGCATPPLPPISPLRPLGNPQLPPCHPRRLAAGPPHAFLAPL